MARSKWIERVSSWWRKRSSLPKIPQRMELEAPVSPSQRCSGRLTRAVQVVSTDVPGLQAVTKDLSAEGLRLAATAELEVGQQVQLNILFSDAELFPIRFVGECRWSTPTAEGPVDIGIDLAQSSPRALSVLQRFLESQSAD